MKLNRTSAWICCVTAVILILQVPALAASAQIKQGKWFCVAASYNDTLITGFEATFTIKSEAKYEASFSSDGDMGTAISNYRISTSGDTLISRFNKIFSTHGSGWSTTGKDTIYYYSLNCSEDIWIKAGQTALGYGFPGSATVSRIVFSSQGDTLLTLKSVDGKTVLTYTYGYPKIAHNPVLFRVQMGVQKQLGNFNPGAGDKVVIRGDFNNWAGNATLMAEGDISNIYEATVDFNYAFIDSDLTYKFVIVKSGGSEKSESDPARTFVLKPHGQNLGAVYFDRRARTDVVNAFPIAEGNGNERAPATAYNSRRDEYLVVWMQEPSDVYGRIFKADGTPNSQPFPVAASAAFEEAYPQVDYNTRLNEYMVVWEDDRNGNWDVYGVRLGHDGKKMVSPNSGADTSFAVCTQDSSQFDPRIAYNYIDNCYLVVWLDYRNSRTEQMMRVNLDVYGQRIAANGALLLPGNPQDPKVNFAIARSSYDEFYPDVAYCGSAGKKLNEWLVVFARREASAHSYYYGSRIWGVRVKGNSGDLLNSWGAKAEPDALGKAAGSIGGPPWLPEFPIGWDTVDFWAMIPFQQGSPHVDSNDDPAPVSLSKTNAARYPIPEFFVSWTDFRDNGDIYGQRVAYFPDSTAYRLKLKDVRGPDSLFTAILVDRNGDWPEDPMTWMTWPNYAVTDDPSYQSWNNMSYGSNDGAFLVVWNDWRAAFVDEWQNPMPNADVYGQRLWLNPADSALIWIDHEGNRGIDPALNTPIAFLEADEGNEMYPAVAFGEKDNSFLAAYQYTEDGNSIDIYANLYKGSLLFPSGVDSRERKGTPADFALGQNYPNPFNPDTRIHYSLPEGGRVQLKVFDLLGREVATLVNGSRTAGSHAAEWNGRLSDGTQASSGVFVYRLHWSKDGRSIVKSGKMVLVR